MSYLLLSLGLYLAPVLDWAVMPRCRVAGAAPQLVLLAGFAWIAIYRRRKAFIGAALTGLVADVSGEGRLGVCFGLLTVASLLVDVLATWWPQDRPSRQLALVAAGTAAGVFLVSVCGPRPEVGSIDWQPVLRWSAITGIYTALLAWPLLAVVHARRQSAYC